MSVLGSVYTPVSRIEPDIESQGYELTRKGSTNRYSRGSLRGSISERSPLSLTAAQPTIWKRASLRATDAVEISVGEGKDLQQFRAHRRQLFQHSAYFRDVLSNNRTSRTRRSVLLGGEEPPVFALFCDWLSKQEAPQGAPPPYVPNSYSDEPWRSLAAQAWVLGTRLDAADFTHYAFCQFVLNCALVDLSTWEFIEAQTDAGSTLRRFSNHWIAWNTSLAQTEYATLEAASLSDQVSENTRDPRTYHTDHWKLQCSDALNSACDHNVGTKAITTQRPKRRYSEKGRDWELGQQNGFSSSPTPSPPSPRSPPSGRPASSPSRGPPPPARRSPSPAPASPSTERLRVSRHHRWISAICTILTIIVLGLSPPLLPYANSDFSIRYKTITFSIFLACFAALLCLLHGLIRYCGGLRMILLLVLNGLVCIFSFAAAIATAVDASSCNKADVAEWFGSNSPCRITGALSAFNWFNLCAFVALTVSTLDIVLSR